MIIGVVAEGPTDVVTLEVFLTEWFNRNLQGNNFEIRPLQPSIDSTSGVFSDGGWTWVKAWCENNPPRERAELYFQPLFDGESPCDVLLVVLDGDVVDEYVRDYPEMNLPRILSSNSRARIVEEVLVRWLWGSMEGLQEDEFAPRYCLGKAIQALETWFIAGLDQSIFEPEEVAPEQILLQLVPGLKTKMRGGRRRLTKTTKAWRVLAEDTRSEMVHIFDTCPHFRELIECIEEKNAQIR